MDYSTQWNVGRPPHELCASETPMFVIVNPKCGCADSYTPKEKNWISYGSFLGDCENFYCKSKDNFGCIIPYNWLFAWRTLTEKEKKIEWTHKSIVKNIDWENGEALHMELQKLRWNND